MDKAAKIVLAVIGFLAGMCLIPIGLIQLMAEGPHGPHGEITGDPSSPLRMMLICGTGAAIMVGAAVLANSARRT